MADHDGIRRGSKGVLVVSAVVMVGLFARLTWVEIELGRYSRRGVAPARLVASKAAALNGFIAVTVAGLAAGGVLLVVGVQSGESRLDRNWYFRKGCQHCDYSRRGLHGTGGRCPECGKIAAG